MELAIQLPLHTFLAANSSSAKVWERQCALHISQGYTLPRKPNKHRRWNDNKPKNWTVDKWVPSQSLKPIGFIFNSLQRESEIGDCSLQIESPSGKLELKLSFLETEIGLLQLLGWKCKTELEKEYRGLKIWQGRKHCTFIRLSLTDNNLDLCPLQRIQPTDQKIPWNSDLETENLYWTKKGRRRGSEGLQTTNLIYCIQVLRERATGQVTKK